MRLLDGAIDVVSIDGGLARLGAVRIRTDGRRHEALDVGVFTSKPRFRDFDVRVADDRVRRCRELHAWLDRFCGIPDVVVAETMGFARGTNAVVCMSLAWGVISCYLESHRLGLISATAGYWRTCLIGAPAKKLKTKKERDAETRRREKLAHAAAVRSVPSFAPIARKLPDEHQLHALDALGVFVWSLSTRDLMEVLLRAS